MATHVEFEQWVPSPLDYVFAFFSNPENLPRVMPAASQTKILRIERIPPPAPHQHEEHMAGPGSVIVTSFRLFPYLPFRAQWIARIAEFEWNHYFVDVQERGPFKSWRHRHEFLTESRNGVTGTLVRDQIEYEAGFGFLGTIADAIFVQRQMQMVFAGRQANLPNLLRNNPRA